ncbi:AraC-type DNA-binding protein [Aquimarina amphilecti]|uniref:AraC-type DNA-binding protein n=1 Tax=Aquimarina amphilecti TaxID=1038014 RepID=A0A1H7I736_AQUAM|nr:helix-turn-helix domain-containing protein [Aquimarina amphilecti]SEK56375.1 AraC-type DNA-binding protein [Aquimarina amphilecti]
MGVDSVGFIPLASFPFPYKYLMAVGFYFYIKSQVSKKEKAIFSYEFILFIPAIIYGLLRAYWYFILHTGIDKDIFWNVYKSGFFLYNEFVYLVFNLLVMIGVLRFIKSRKKLIKGSVSTKKNWEWLLVFSKMFVIVIIFNLLHQIIANSFELQHSGKFYYIILVLNSVYIYWIGFIGFTKSNLLFKTFNFNEVVGEEDDLLKNRIEHFIIDKEAFTNRNFKVSDLALLLSISEKELSLYIHNTYHMSFTDFINAYRVEKVKKLLISSDQEKFTLLAISEKAGFSSKSSFNAVFKKVTGLTPTQYKKNHKNE